MSKKNKKEESAERARVNSYRSLSEAGKSAAKKPKGRGAKSRRAAPVAKAAEAAPKKAAPKKAAPKKAAPKKAAPKKAAPKKAAPSRSASGRFSPKKAAAKTRKAVARTNPLGPGSRQVIIPVPAGYARATNPHMAGHMGSHTGGRSAPSYPVLRAGRRRNPVDLAGRHRNGAEEIEMEQTTMPFDVDQGGQTSAERVAEIQAQQAANVDVGAAFDRGPSIDPRRRGPVSSIAISKETPAEIRARLLAAAKDRQRAHEAKLAEERAKAEEKAEAARARATEIRDLKRAEEIQRAERQGDLDKLDSIIERHEKEDAQIAANEKIDKAQIDHDEALKMSKESRRLAAEARDSREKAISLRAKGDPISTQRADDMDDFATRQQKLADTLASRAKDQYESAKKLAVSAKKEGATKSLRTGSGAASVARESKRSSTRKMTDEQKAELSAAQEAYPELKVTGTLDEYGNLDIQYGDKMASKTKADKSAKKASGGSKGRGRKKQPKAVKDKLIALRKENPGKKVRAKRKEDGTYQFTVSGRIVSGAVAATAAKKAGGKKGKKADKKATKKASGKTQPIGVVRKIERLQKEHGTKDVHATKRGKTYTYFVDGKALPNEKKKTKGKGKSTTKKAAGKGKAKSKAKAKDNPLVTRGQVVVGAIGVTSGLVFGTILDRFVATRRGNSVAEGPHYGADAAIRILRKPDAVRMGVQVLGGAVFVGLGSLAEANHPALGAFLVGQGIGHVGLAAAQGIVSHLLPMIFKATDSQEKTLATRLYGIDQEYPQKVLTDEMNEIDAFPVRQDDTRLLAGGSDTGSAFALNLTPSFFGEPISTKPAGSAAPAAGSDAPAAAPKAGGLSGITRKQAMDRAQHLINARNAKRRADMRGAVSGVSAVGSAVGSHTSMEDRYAAAYSGKAAALHGDCTDCDEANPCHDCEEKKKNTAGYSTNFKPVTGKIDPAQYVPNSAEAERAAHNRSRPINNGTFLPDTAAGRAAAPCTPDGIRIVNQGQAPAAPTATQDVAPNPTPVREPAALPPASRIPTFTRTPARQPVPVAPAAPAGAAVPVSAGRDGVVLNTSAPAAPTGQAAQASSSLPPIVQVQQAPAAPSTMLPGVTDITAAPAPLRGQVMQPSGNSPVPSSTTAPTSGVIMPSNGRAPILETFAAGTRGQSQVQANAQAAFRGVFSPTGRKIENPLRSPHWGQTARKQPRRNA